MPLRRYCSMCWKMVGSTFREKVESSFALRYPACEFGGKPGASVREGAGVGDEVAVADLQCHCLVGIGGGVAG